MTDRIDAAPVDPLRSGGIFRLSRAGPTASRLPTAVPAPATPAGFGGGPAAGSAPFNEAYSARVRARFTELYRATPIPVSILYDTPQSKAAATPSTIGSADSGAPTVAGSPAATSAATHETAPMVGAPQPSSAGAMGGIQIPLKEPSKSVDLFSPPTRRHHRSSRQGSAEGSGNRSSSKHHRSAEREVISPIGAYPDRNAALVARTLPGAAPSSAPVGRPDGTPRVVKRLRPELVPAPSPSEAATHSVNDYSNRSVRRSSTKKEAEVPSRVAANRALYNDATRSASSAAKDPEPEEDFPPQPAVPQHQLREEEEIGEEDSFASGSQEDDLDEFDGMGEFLERALADADSDDDEEEAGVEPEEHSELPNVDAVDSTASEGEEKELDDHVVEATGVAVEPVAERMTEVVEAASPLPSPAPAEVAPIAPLPADVRPTAPAPSRGRAAMQMNSFLSILPPPRAPTTKSVTPGPSVAAGSPVMKGTVISTVPAEEASATRTTPNTRKPVLPKSEPKEKVVKKTCAPAPSAGGGLRVVRLHDLGLSRRAFEGDNDLDSLPSPVKKRRTPQKPPRENKTRGASQDTVSKSCQDEDRNQLDKRAGNRKSEEPLEAAPPAKKAVIKTSKPQESSIVIPALSPSGAAAAIFESDINVWSDEEFSVLKEAYNAVPLAEPNFWSVVAIAVNEWRKELYEIYKSTGREATWVANGKGKRGRGRKASADSTNKPMAPLVLRAADHCQTRWFKTMNISAPKRKASVSESSDQEADKKPRKRMTKAMLRNIVGKAVIGRPDDIFDALDSGGGVNNGQDQGIGLGKIASSRSAAAVNYYKKRDRADSESPAAPTSDEKRLKSESGMSSTESGRVLRSRGKDSSSEKVSTEKTLKSVRKKTLIYTPQDLAIEQGSEDQETPQLADRIATRSAVKGKSAVEKSDADLDEVKRYLYERPTGATGKKGGTEGATAAWTASYASNLSKRKVPLPASANAKSKKNTRSFSAEASFHNKSDGAVMDALRAKKAASKSPKNKRSEWRPKPSGRVKAKIDSVTGRVITSVDAGEDDSADNLDDMSNDSSDEGV